jgi:hypothetical protein
MRNVHATRRQVLAGIGTALAAAPILSARTFAAESTSNSLGAIAAEKGILFGASFAVHERDAPYGKAYAEMYVRDARILTSELGFKLASLRPSPDKLDF